MKREKLIQVNGVRAVVRHSQWMGWTAQHVMDGQNCSGSGARLSEIRKGLHAVTSKASREKLKARLV